MAAGKVRQGGVYVEIGADPKPFFAALNRVGAKASQFGASLTSLGTRISGAAVGLAAPMGVAVARFAQFDDAIRSVAAVTGSFGAQGAAAFKMLNDRARELGATTSFTAVQVAELMTTLGRAGFDASQIDSMTDAVLDLSRATGTEASTAAGIMSTALRQFSLGAGEATRIADLLTVTANGTFNTVEALGEALTYAGTSAAQAGLSVEETTALLGALGNVGIQGSRAGTMLRRLTTLAGAEAKKLEAIFGVNFLDGDGNVRNIIEIFKDLGDATNDLPSGERIKKFNDAFGLLGITGAQAIGGSIGDVEELVEAIGNGEGTAKRTAKEMDAGLGGAFRKLLSAAEGTALAFADALAPSLQVVVETFTMLAGRITTIVKENAELIATIAKIVGVVAVVGGALIGFGVAFQVVGFAIAGFSVAGGALMGIFGAISAAATLVGTVISVAISSPLIIAAAAALAVGGALFYFLGGLQTITDLGSGVFADMGEQFSTTFEGMNAALANGDLAGAANIAFLSLSLVFQKGLAGIMGFWDGFITFFQDGWDLLSTYAINAGRSLFAAVVGVFDNIVNSVMSVWDELERGIRKTWAKIVGITSSGVEVQAELEGIDKEIDDRKKKREEGTGVVNRMKTAQKQNDADTQAMGERMLKREEANQQNAAGRQAGIDETQGQLDSATNEQKQTQKDRSLADVLLAQLAETTDIDEMNTLIEMLNQMRRDGVLSDEQDKAFDTNTNTAASNIDAGFAAEDKKDAASDGAGNAEKELTKGTSQGTFSAFGAVMGFGRNDEIMLLERIAASTEESAKKPQPQFGS